MQQIYMRTHMQKNDFKKVANQLWKEQPFRETPARGYFWIYNISLLKQT